MVAQTKSVPEINITDEIKRLLRHGTVEPLTIARKIEPMLSPKQRANMVMPALVAMIRRTLSDIRLSSMMVEERDAKGNIVKSFDADKWRMGRVEVDGKFVALTTLTADMCDYIAKVRKALAQTTALEGMKYSMLAKAIRKHGVQTAGELSESVLSGIFK